jgi:hypothetical protein
MRVVTPLERTERTMPVIDLTFRPRVYIKALHAIRATITPRTAKGTAWLSQMIMLSDPVELDKPVTLSLDGAIELDDLARADHLHTEGL